MQMYIMYINTAVDTCPHMHGCRRLPIPLCMTLISWCSEWVCGSAYSTVSGRLCYGPPPESSLNMYNVMYNLMNGSTVQFPPAITYTNGDRANIHSTAGLFILVTV